MFEIKEDLNSYTSFTEYTILIKMSNITLAVPEDLKKKLDSMPEINWSESVREFLTKRAARLLLLKKIDKLLENSEFTEEDAEKFGELAKRHRLKELKSKGII